MSQSIGKILDEFEAGTITKQQAVTKLQNNRNHAVSKVTEKAVQAERERLHKAVMKVLDDEVARVQQQLVQLNDMLVTDPDSSKELPQRRPEEQGKET